MLLYEAERGCSRKCEHQFNVNTQRCLNATGYPTNLDEMTRLPGLQRRKQAVSCDGEVHKRRPALREW